MAHRPSGCDCKICGDAIRSRACRLRCVNFATGFHGFSPCNGVFHVECWAADERFETALVEKKFRRRGLAMRDCEAELLASTFICELCVVRSQVGDAVPEGSLRFRELLVYERLGNETAEEAKVIQVPVIKA